MIQYVTGDILLTDAEAIAHGIAPSDHFKQGLALSLREQWPALYKDFRHYCQMKHPVPGEVWSWKGVNGPYIISLMTQEAPESHDSHPGKASLPNVNHALKNLSHEISEKGLKSVAISKLATGVGGLSWEDVKPMIEKYFSDSNAVVYVYETYAKDQKANEA